MSKENLNTMKIENKTNMYVKKSSKSSSTENSSTYSKRVSKEEIEAFEGASGDTVIQTDTPFNIIRMKELKKYIIALGPYQASPTIFDTKEEAERQLKKVDWYLVGSLIQVLIKELKKKETQKENE